MTATKKKMNTYLKMGLILIACVLAGAALGILIVTVNLDGVGGGMAQIVTLVRRGIFPLTLILLLGNTAVGEVTLRKMHTLGNRLSEAEDEEGDYLEFAMERLSAVATVGNTVFTALATLVLSTGYSMEYIADTDGNEGSFLLAAMVLYIILMIYGGYWSVRYVKYLQKICPEKYGDPTSLKFQEQWLQSCDEAEREIIYQASYKSYLTTTKFTALLLIISMLCHLIWDTGIMAVLMVCLMQLVMTISYCRACVKKKGTKLNV
ncbi:MAG: DUF3169 family protein [Eubacteriales bacterium]|nr:DUF3169 family protein [Eubacteriales bacterium]